MKRLAAIPAVASALVWSFATPAAADGASPGVSTGSPALSWIDFTDTKGVPLWNLEISLDQGSVSSPQNILWSAFIQMFWDLYRNIVALAIWFIDWALSFRWLDAIATPVVALSQGLRQVVDQFGATTLLLTIAAAVAVVWMARGRWSTGIFELMMSLVIAVVAAGVFVNPVNNVTGSGGWLLESRDLGMEIAADMASGDELPVTVPTDGAAADSETVRANLTKQMVTIFIRKPLQLLNFGQILDDGDCAQTYQDALMGGPYGTNADIREAVGGCNEDLLPYAENPGPPQLVSALVLFPAAVIILLFGVVLGGGVLVASVYCLFQALKAIVVLLLGLLPGRARGALWVTAADLAIALVTVVFSITFLSVYLLLLDKVFANANSGGIMPTFFFVDVLLLVGVILYWRGRAALKRASRSLAEALSKRPTGTPGRAGPTPLPSPGQGIPVGQLAGQANSWRRHRQLMDRFSGKPDRAGTTSGGGTTSTSSKSGSHWWSALGNLRRTKAPGPAARPHPGRGPGYTAQTQLEAGETSGQPQLGPGGGPRPGRGGPRLAVKAITSTGRTLALHTAAAVASGGTSTVASAAAAGHRAQRLARTAKTATRTARQVRLAAQLTAPQKRAAITSTPDPGTRRPVVIQGTVYPPRSTTGTPAQRPAAVRPRPALPRAADERIPAPQR